MTTSLR